MAAHCYPIASTPYEHIGCTVKVDGVTVPLDTARVSAMPLNRRWPGHQRTLDQTALINFLSLSIDGPVTFEVIPGKPFEAVEIRPRSLGIQPSIKDGIITFTLEKPAYFTVEPYGRQDALHIFADPKADYAVDKDDPNTIYFAPGIHEPGQILLKSNQTLYLEEGALVYGCVTARDAHNIRILGRGILDNSRNKAQILFPVQAQGNFAAVKNAKRQHTIRLEYCDDVTIDGITIRDSLVYNIRPLACRRLHISHVKIIGCWRYNSDGIDMHNCEDVLIEDCFLRTFDDSICVKGFDCYYNTDDVEKAVQEAMNHNGHKFDVFKNVLVRRCTVWNDWGKALEIGAETRAEEMYNITFTDCNVIHFTGPVLDCTNVDYADIHDVIYQNITIEADTPQPQPMLQDTDETQYAQKDIHYVPAFIRSSVNFHAEYSVGSNRLGINRDILFENIRYYGTQKPRIQFIGADQTYTSRDITVRRVFINDKPLSQVPYSLEQDEACSNITVSD